MITKKHLIREALHALERMYLRACGWTFIGNDEWIPPESYPFHKKYHYYRTGHALNSQKLCDSRES